MSRFAAGQKLTLTLRMLGTRHAVAFAGYDVTDSERIAKGAYQHAVAVIGPLGNRVVVDGRDLEPMPQPEDATP